MKQRLLNILIALDQLIYALVTLGYGSPLETLSAGIGSVSRGRSTFSVTRSNGLCSHSLPGAGRFSSG